jgi:hypothetical protein
MIIVSTKAPPPPPPKCTCNIPWDFKFPSAVTSEKQVVNDFKFPSAGISEIQTANDIKLVLEYTIS